MELLQQGLSFLVHLDVHLSALIQQYGVWTYGILFLIVFCETGLVVTPFLPGDSLLFAAGAFAARGVLNPWVLCGVLSAAAVVGDTVNYWIGHAVGPAVFTQRHTRFFKKEHLDRTHRFYERHGGKTIVLARFIPIIRTFAPFVAGIGRMTYRKFLAYNVGGGLLWVFLFVFGGYAFGNHPVVERHFSLVVLVIIVLSILPGVLEFLHHRATPVTTPGKGGRRA